MFRQYKLRDFRLRLVVLVYAISILSVFVIGSAAEEYQSQQLLGIMMGSVIMLIFALLDYRVLLNFSWVIYAVNLILLVAVIPFGVKVNGARRWLKIGFFRFQPSELTKLALIGFAWHSATAFETTATSVSDDYYLFHFLRIDFFSRTEL